MPELPSESTLNRDLLWPLARSLEEQSEKINNKHLSPDDKSALEEKFFMTLEALTKKPLEVIKDIGENYFSAKNPVHRYIHNALALFYKRQIDALVNATDGFLKEIDQERNALRVDYEKPNSWRSGELFEKSTQLKDIQKDVREFRSKLIASIPQSLVSMPGFGKDNTKSHGLNWEQLRNNIVEGLALLSEKKEDKIFKGTNSSTSFLKTIINNVAQALGLSPIFNQHHFKEAVGKVRENVRVENPGAKIDDDKPTFPL